MDPAGNDDGAFVFASEGPGTDRVAEPLLEAWLTGEPGDLETYLEHGEEDLPKAQRQLIAAFWQAIGTDVDGARAIYEQVRGQQGVTTASSGFSARPWTRWAAAVFPWRRPRGDRAPRSRDADDPPRRRGRGAARRAGVRALGRVVGLIKLEIAADWAPHRSALLGWARQLEQAQANHRFSARGEWPSIEVTVQRNDTLTGIRKRVIRARQDITICTGLIEASNGITASKIRPDDVLRIPTDSANCIVDLEARLVMYRHGDEIVRAWACGIGKPGHETPIGEYTVGVKVEKPAHTTWGLPYGHPDNPLGSHWLALERDGRKTSYGLHGTNDPDGVGGEGEPRLHPHAQRGRRGVVPAPAAGVAGDPAVSPGPGGHGRTTRGRPPRCGGRPSSLVAIQERDVTRLAEAGPVACDCATEALDRRSESRFASRC